MYIYIYHYIYIYIITLFPKVGFKSRARPCCPRCRRDVQVQRPPDGNGAWCRSWKEMTWKIQWFWLWYVMVVSTIAIHNHTTLQWFIYGIWMILNDSEWFYIESAWFLNDSWMILTISPSISISTEELIDSGIPTDGFFCNICCLLSHLCRALASCKGIRSLVAPRWATWDPTVLSPIAAMAEASFDELRRLRELVPCRYDLRGTETIETDLICAEKCTLKWFFLDCENCMKSLLYVLFMASKNRWQTAGCEAAHCRQTPPPRITRLDRRSGQVWCSAGFQIVREAWDFERWNKHLVCRSFVACVIWIIAESSRVQRRSV